MTTITIPHEFEPRPYQIKIFQAIDNGCRNAVSVWHRRAGKDKTFINIMLKQALERVGNYYYYFPTMSQGRKTIWQGRDKAGMAFLDHIPREIIENKRDQEMRIELKNGSAIQIMGTDRLEVVGPNPVGCVFSEYSLQNPSGYNYIRPILIENKGWRLFNFTPRGFNHAYELYTMAKNNPKWFCELLTVDDTQAISKEDIQDEIDSGMSPELVAQEFYCSFEYGLEGAYYLKQIALARKEGRIVNIPLEDTLVHTAWDLGISDYMVIWFFQMVGREVHLIDYYENHNEGLAHYVFEMQERAKERKYVYGTHLAPHDIRVRELTTGKSRLERAAEMGIDFTTVEMLPIQEGIEAVRSIFKRCWFDEERAKNGINAIMNYQKELNESKNVFHDRPLHNWASHGADAFRTLANGLHKVESYKIFEEELYPEWDGDV